jgi:hypothetical protein
MWIMENTLKTMDWDWAKSMCSVHTGDTGTKGEDISTENSRQKSLKEVSYVFK